jgi:hypothetical protein
LQDVVKDLGAKLNLGGCDAMTECFGLCEARDGVTMEAFLPGDTPIVPILVSWEAGKILEVAKFVFKVKLFMQSLRAPEDPHLCYMAYIQNVYQVITGLVPVTTEEAISLAALQVQIKFGNHKEEVHTKGFLSRSGQLKGLVPAPMLLRRAMTAWDDDILARHKILNDDARSHPMQMYCRMLMTRETYGCEVFPAAQSFTSSLPESIALGVCLVGVFVLSVDDKRVLDRFTLSELYRWGFTAGKSFYVELKPQCSRPGTPCTVPPSAEKGNRFDFSTKHGRYLSDLLTDYAKRILAEITSGKTSPAATVETTVSITADAAAAASSLSVEPRMSEDAAAVAIQSHVRGFLLRQSMEREAAAIKLQALWRGYRARLEFDRMLEEAEAEYA